MQDNSTPGRDLAGYIPAQVRAEVARVARTLERLMPPVVGALGALARVDHAIDTLLPDDDDALDEWSRMLETSGLGRAQELAELIELAADYSHLGSAEANTPVD